MLYVRTTQCCMTGLHSVVWQDYTVFVFSTGSQRWLWIKLLSFRPSFIYKIVLRLCISKHIYWTKCCVLCCLPSEICYRKSKYVREFIYGGWRVTRQYMLQQCVLAMSSIVSKICHSNEETWCLLKVAFYHVSQMSSCNSEWVQTGVLVSFHTLWHNCCFLCAVWCVQFCAVIALSLCELLSLFYVYVICLRHLLSNEFQSFHLFIVLSLFYQHNSILCNLLMNVEVHLSLT